MHKELEIVEVDYQKSEEFHDYVCYMMSEYIRNGYCHVQIISKEDKSLILEVDYFKHSSNGLLSHHTKNKSEEYIANTWGRYRRKHINDDIWAVIKGRAALPEITSNWLCQKH